MLSLADLSAPDHEPLEDFELELADALGERLLADDQFADACYAALCNQAWRRRSDGELYSCSWRSAGGLIARIRNRQRAGAGAGSGDLEGYLDFYCNGGEGDVRPDVLRALAAIGWDPVPEPYRAPVHHR